MSSGWSKIETVTIGASDGGGHDHLSSVQNLFSPPIQSGGSSEGLIAGISLTETVLLVVVAVVLILSIVITFYYRRRVPKLIEKPCL